MKGEDKENIGRKRTEGIRIKRRKLRCGTNIRKIREK
jgi:hypothetical protein